MASLKAIDGQMVDNERTDIMESHEKDDGREKDQSVRLQRSAISKEEKSRRCRTIRTADRGTRSNYNRSVAK
jgi:hypothetical protein